MGYDIKLGVMAEIPRMDGDAFIPMAEPSEAHPTYNLRRLLTESMEWDFAQGELYYVPEVLPSIDYGISRLEKHPEAYEQYSAANGWGSPQDALVVLRSLYDCIVGLAAEWPVEAIWMKW